MMMKFRLHQQQYVSLDSRVNFHHPTGSHHSYVISLNDDQMKNLDDILSCPSLLHSKSCIPLGSGIWLHLQRKTASLVNSVSGCFFRFFPSSWNRYKESVHRRICHKHGRSQGDQHRPHHDSEPLAQFRADLLQFRQQRSSSRSSRNVGHAYEQRSQSTNVSRRKSANLRQSKARRGGRDAARTRHEIEDDSTKPASIIFEDCESRSERSAEERDSSPDYFLE